MSAALWLLCVVAIGSPACASDPLRDALTTPRDVIRSRNEVEVTRWVFKVAEHSDVPYHQVRAGSLSRRDVADLGFAETAQHRGTLHSPVLVEFDGEYPTRRPPSDARRWMQAYEQAVLGDAYWRGSGVDRDLEKAVALYRRAALAGSALGMSGLARAHYQGRGAERNLEVAVHWLERAADERSSAAYFELALHYRRGTTGAANPNKAQENLAQGLDIAAWRASRSSIDRERTTPVGAAYMSAGDVFACTEAAPPDLGLAMAFWIRAAIEGYPGLWWRMRRLVPHFLLCPPFCGRC